MTAIEVTLHGPFGSHKHMVTSVAQVNAHLREYAWRVLMVKAKPGRFPDPNGRLRQLYATCDQLLDAGLMLRAVTQWQRASCFDLDLAELGVTQDDEDSSEEVAA